MAQAPFVQAVNSPRLLEACELLAGPGRWRPRHSMGSFPFRLPHDAEPDGLGWHVEGSYMPEGASAWWTNFGSRDRALLALFLFTDIDMEDGPTRIRVGSHLAVPAVLEPMARTAPPVPPLLAGGDSTSLRYPSDHTTRPDRLLGLIESRPPPPQCGARVGVRGPFRL
jgi:hypothetical protein